MSGLKYDSGKAQYDLLPWRALHEVARVMTFGAAKYRPNSWRGVPNAKRRYFAAAIRHLQQWRCGESHDSESGLHHLAHAATNALFVLALDMKRKPRT